MNRSVQLTSGHLLFDHARLRNLLDVFERSRNSALRTRVMRAALDLYYVHTWLEESLFPFGLPQFQNILSEKANRLESLEPASALYYDCAFDFAKHLRGHMAEEERVFRAGARLLSEPAPFDSEVLVQRRQILEDVSNLLRASQAAQASSGTGGTSPSQ